MFAVGDEPPAVVSLLARRLDQDGFAATLLDLAARGWFHVSPPEVSAQPAGAWGPGGPAMCVIAARPPAQQLAPYERRVAAHLALRAGVQGEVPAPALRDGFHSGEAEFMKGFREEVAADARQRGLTGPWLRPRRIIELCALLLVPAVSLVLAVGHSDALGSAAVAYIILAGVTIRIGTSQRPSEAGQAALRRWRAAVAAEQGGGRLEAYAVALGRAPAAAAVFAPLGKNMAWSSYRGSWQQIAIETIAWSWRRSLALLLAMIFVPIAYFYGVFWLFANGMAALAEQSIGLVVAATAAVIVVWLARRRLFPQFVEFDGQVIRQWLIDGGDDDPDRYHVAIDDGVRDQAWNLDVGSEGYQRLPPGTFVHVRVNLRNRDQVSVDRVEPPPRRWLRRSPAGRGLAGEGNHGSFGTKELEPGSGR